MKDAPSPEQRAVLYGYGITLPQGIKRRSCQTLISFIRQGNSTVGKTEQERIVILNDFLERWVGARVRDRGGGVEGVVLYFFIHSPDKLFALSVYRKKIRIENTFTAVVRCYSGRIVQIPLGRLEIITAL